MNVRGATLVAALAVASCGDRSPSSPAPVPTPQGPAARTSVSPPKAPDDPPAVAGACTAIGHDDLRICMTMIGPDACSGDPPPAIHITGRLADADGAPVPRTSLRFWSRTSIKNALTEADGTFDLVTDVEHATYDVDALMSSSTNDHRLHAGTLHPGDHDVVLKLNGVPNVLAAGTLLDDGGRPLAGWTVEADEVRTGRDVNNVGSATTDADGRFRITAWEKEPVTLRARAPEGRPRTIMRRDSEAGTGELRVAVAPPGVAGRVVVESGASPAGAIVRLRRDADGTMRSVVVDDSGVFQFDRLDPAAVYDVSAELSGFTEVPIGGCAGDSQDVRLFLIAPDQFLAGRAVDWKGAPLANAWLRFVAANGTGGLQTMTDADGAFSTTDARDVDYDAFVLVTGPDGRLVPGPKLGRVRGGDRTLALRVPR